MTLVMFCVIATAIAGKGDELLSNPDVGRLFLGG